MNRSLDNSRAGAAESTAAARVRVRVRCTAFALQCCPAVLPLRRCLSAALSPQLYLLLVAVFAPSLGVSA